MYLAPTPFGPFPCACAGSVECGYSLVAEQLIIFRDHGLLSFMNEDLDVLLLSKYNAINTEKNNNKIVRSN
jgi:hypothetical protein